MRENAATKATRYLIEGRVMIHHLDHQHLEATCRGDGHIWRQTHTRSRGWTCDCPARSDKCAHLRAIRTVVTIDHATASTTHR